jgi:threonylcarbamoyladenosine tRNA methylthiotransferase MtaB
VNICQYAAGRGLDTPGLGGLIAYLLAGTTTIRLRLSSLEPDDIDGALLASLRNPRLRPHFHLSLQSGSAKILERMGRPYDPEKAVWAASRLREIKDDPFLACDMITGFPGETQEDFEQTLELCGRIDFAWIHAFPYSPRPGTAAWDFGEQVPQREAKARVEQLLALARLGRRAYTARWIGRTVEFIPEGKGRTGGPPSGTGTESGLGGYLSGTSENYLKLLAPRLLAGAQEGSAPGGSAGGVLRCVVRELPGSMVPDVPPGGEFDALGELCRGEDGVLDPRPRFR